ncbi:MAG: porphobilinogen synthase [Armatimonadetes bacterium]|nr:porphobilinogen synthase [Armatimonadota bacterium]
MAQFPVARMRRLRATENTRRLVRETRLSVDDFIYPLFVVEGSGVRREIGAMPGNFHWSVDRLPAVIDEAAALGVPGVLLFGIPDAKDEEGSEAYAEDGIAQKAVRAIKRANPDMLVVTDVCLCEYTSHGHCGVVTPEGRLLNDPTLALLQRTALSHARAGADIVAPSDMMDGRVGALRAALDEQGFDQVPIMAYAAKYASGFYGPFREAAGSAPQFGDRRSYQMDPANRREALREMALDADEGADILMVKPALSYLDIIREARDRFDLPLAAYNVSGEYSMVKAAAANRWIDGERIMMEILTSIKRAGADMILTYHALEAARLLEH